MTSSRNLSPRGKKRKKVEELQQKILLYATPEAPEVPAERTKRKSKKRKLQWNINKLMEELSVHSDPPTAAAAATTTSTDDQNEERLDEAPVQRCIESNNESNVFRDQLAVNAQLRRRRRAEAERNRRAARTASQRERDNAARRARRTARSLNMSSGEAQELREQRSRAEAQRRADMSDEQRVHQRERHSQLERERLERMPDGQRIVERERRTQSERERRATISQEEQQLERDRHRDSERQRRHAMPADEQTQARVHHSQLEHQRRLNMSEEQRDFQRQRQAALDSERVASRTDQDRERRRDQDAARRAEQPESVNTIRAEQRRDRRSVVLFQVALANHEDFDVAIVVGQYVVNGRHHIPMPSVVCPKCNAWKWKDESESACCLKGKVSLPPLRAAPQCLLDIMHDPIHRPLLRPYNNTMSFTSVGASCTNGRFEHVAEDRSVQGQLGVYTVRIQGALHHYMGSLLPYENPTTGVTAPPAFAQIYVMAWDREGRADRRMSLYSGLDRGVLLILGDMMEEHNPFAREFMSMGERLREMAQNGELPPNMVFQLRANNRAGPRTHNLPAVTEVAAVILENGNGANPRDLILFVRGGGLVRIFETHRFYDPSQYPLLFPYGELGWSYYLEYANGAVHRNKRTMSLREFLANIMHQKEGDKSALHQGGRLFQQYSVDQRAKCEQEILRWIAANQKTIRADLYKGMQDAYLNENTVELGANEGLVSEYDRDTGNLVHPNASRRGHFLEQVGQRIVLPASFTGGDRYMYEQYQDAMAMVREYGKPDLFMTVTCNPKWPEITETIAKYGGPGQDAQDRPDIVARVWQQKLKAVLKDLDDGVFGRQIARIYVVEFQKRGLPHAHILILLAEDDKPRTRRDYDKFVSAELPDPGKNPALFETVMTTMMHGPCGDLDKSSPCMVKGVCSKGFPKPISEVTQTNDSGYPVYRRRRRSEGVLEFKRKRYDNATVNQWVVPYNPFFSQKYDCHINVEVCSTITAVKYLYKYVYKGSDKTEISVQSVRSDVQGSEAPARRREPNEIIRYIKARYISPVEACQRIFDFPIQGKTHTVVKLEIHLADCQYVTFHGTDDPRRVLDETRHTKLTRFFELAASDEEARQTLYKDVPKRFRWDAKERKWVRYKNQRRTIGRLVHCSMHDQERYYLRVMLCHRPGPTSYEDLRTVNGHLCATFKEAAMQAGYLANDDEWVTCMEEAALFQMPYQLRQLFATLLMYSMPANARRLWDGFYDDLSADFEYSHRNVANKDAMVKYKTLKNVHDFLTIGSKALSDFPELPQLSEFPDLMRESLFENTLIRRELQSYDPAELQAVVNDVDRLNVNQREIYDTIIAAVDSNQPEKKVFFIDGPGGTGKSTLIKHLLAKVRSEGKIALAVASSGIAALLLPGGRTAHSTFKIPIDLTKTSTCSIKKQSHLKQLIERASLIVWDEAPMTHRHAFEALDRTLQDLLDNEEPFGGKVFVLSGDFRQTLPVVKNGTQSDTVDASLCKSDLWASFKTMRLTINMRVMGAPDAVCAADLGEFADYLLEVGEGRHVVDPRFGEDCIKLPRDMVIDNPAYDPQMQGDEGEDEVPVSLGLKRIIDAMYSEADLNNPSIATDDYFANRTILAPTNAAVQSVNEAVAQRLQGVTQVYLSTDSIDDDTGEASGFFETEVLNSLNVNGIPPHKLLLKKGAPIMMIRNLNPAEGLCNGTRLRVVELKTHVIRATIMTGAHHGKEVLIPRIIFISNNDIKDFPFRLRRIQFPVVPAFAMTINKAQGQTVHNLGLYLPTPCFSHGQLYVALSRVTSKAKIKVLIDHADGEEDDGLFTNNIVYREIFV